MVFDSTEKVWLEVFHQWFHRQTLNTSKCQTSFWWVMGNKKGQIVQEVFKLSFWELLQKPAWRRWCCASCQPSPCERTTSRWREAQGTRTCACVLSASWGNFYFYFFSVSPEVPASEDLFFQANRSQANLVSMNLFGMKVHVPFSIPFFLASISTHSWFVG